MGSKYYYLVVITLPVNLFVLREEVNKRIVAIVGGFFCFVSVKFLEVIKPFCSILPEIAKPERKVCVWGLGEVLVFKPYVGCEGVTDGKYIAYRLHINLK